MKKLYNPLPDWHTRSLFLVWPRGLYMRTHLIEAYAEVAAHIPVETDLHIILKKMSYRGEIEKIMRSKRPGGVLQFHELPMVSDIWIRDWAPVPVRKTDGSMVLVKAKYRPRYLQGDDAKYAGYDDRAGRELATILGLPLEELPLVWDIGNLTHNGAGIAIVSRRIVTDNGGIPEDALRRLFEEMLGIDRLFLVEEEPGDPFGHVDGTFRFLDESTLAVARYPDHFGEENRWCDERAAELRAAPGNGFQVVPIQNGPIDPTITEGMPSAVGNYCNFLRIGNRLLMPQYGVEDDLGGVEVVQKKCQGLFVTPVGGNGVSEIARLGGVLNCISWAC